MQSPGHPSLPRPSLTTAGDGLPKYIPDDAFGASDFPSFPGITGADQGQEDLRDLLQDIRGEAPSKWNLDAPSFGEMQEPTQGFTGWGCCGPHTAWGGPAGPSETFGAFATHPGQVTDTAGTPFHPASMHMGPPQPPMMMQMHQMQMAYPGSMAPPAEMLHAHHQQQLQMQQHMQMQGQYMQQPSPWNIAPPAMHPAYGFAPAPPGYMPYPCAPFPQQLPCEGLKVAPEMQMQMPSGVYPMSYAPFVAAAAAAATAMPSGPQTSMFPNSSASGATTQTAIAPTSSPPLSSSGGHVTMDGGYSGDEAVVAVANNFKRRKFGSMTSSDSGLQVVPSDEALNLMAAKHLAGPSVPLPQGAMGAPAQPPSSNQALTPVILPGGAGVMLVPYNGALMAVRRPPGVGVSLQAGVALTTGGCTPLPAAAAAAAVSMMPVISTRAACLQRYRQKKAVRSYSKHIRYHMRKVNADRRPRVKGRFIKAEAVAALAEDLNNEIDTCVEST